MAGERAKSRESVEGVVVGGGGGERGLSSALAKKSGRVTFAPSKLSGKPPLASSRYNVGARGEELSNLEPSQLLYWLSINRSLSLACPPSVKG